MTPPDESLVAPRNEVERIFGQCLLRLQTFEMMTKSLVAGHRFSAPNAHLEVAKASRAAETQRKTLGSSVGDMMGSFLVPEGQEGLREEREDAPSVAFMQQIVFPAEDYARIEADHRELVTLRNTLVHHFLDQHDLRTADGCLVAQQTLTTALEQIHRAYDNLRRWTVEMEMARKTIAEHLASPEIRDFFVHGRVPWPTTKISEALLEAAADRAHILMPRSVPESCRSGATQRNPRQLVSGWRLHALHARGGLNPGKQAYARWRAHSTAPGPATRAAITRLLMFAGALPSRAMAPFRPAAPAPGSPAPPARQARPRSV